MGPLRLADMIGLDVCRDIMLVMHNGLGHADKYAPSSKLVELVEAGHLGNKTGRGVYDYSG
jgi:3-hydroxybutyryl-CoA dehydrogenase